MSYSLDSTQDTCYPGTTVLVNKLGLRSQEALDEAEKVAVPLRSMELEQETIREPFTFSFYCSLHERLFGDIYPWAGQIRTVDLSKKGTSFCPASRVKELGEAKFQRLQEMDELRGLPRDAFIHEITDLYHEINMLHPFREGNGRTQRLFFTLLIRRAGYDISFADYDTDRLMIATILAAQGVMDHLEDFFRTAIIE